MAAVIYVMTVARANKMKKSDIMHSLLLKDRGVTDVSLVAERGKTDHSFAGYRRQTELETDRQIKSDRLEADDACIQSRIKTDATTNLGRAGRTKEAMTRTTVEVRADNYLRAQRDQDDAALSFERTLMDAALVRERGLNDVESLTFLVNERNETDKCLLEERVHTDHDYVMSKNRLNSEQTSHDVTRAALTSRDEFLAIVGHDLRNPVGTILSYGELLLEDSPRTLAEAKAWAEVITRNARLSLRLINDILDIERHAEGKLLMEFADCNMNRIILETVENFEHVAAAKNIRLDYLSPAGCLTVDCDGHRIARVLTNLIGNALKFTPEGGRVSVSAECTGNEFRMLVRDTGPGIPEEQKKNIFNRYAQLTNKDRQGLGLGLYISAMLVGAHQGKIEISSELGAGSTFSVMIPIKRTKI